MKRANSSDETQNGFHRKWESTAFGHPFGGLQFDLHHTAIGRCDNRSIDDRLGLRLSWRIELVINAEHPIQLASIAHVHWNDLSLRK